MWLLSSSSDQIDVKRIRSTNPGFCYMMAGWERGNLKRGKLFLWAPITEATALPLAAE